MPYPIVIPTNRQRRVSSYNVPPPPFPPPPAAFFVEPNQSPLRLDNHNNNDSIIRNDDDNDESSSYRAAMMLYSNSSTCDTATTTTTTTAPTTHHFPSSTSGSRSHLSIMNMQGPGGIWPNGRNGDDDSPRPSGWNYQGHFRTSRSAAPAPFSSPLVSQNQRESAARQTAQALSPPRRRLDDNKAFPLNAPVWNSATMGGARLSSGRSTARPKASSRCTTCASFVLASVISLHIQ